MFNKKEAEIEAHVAGNSSNAIGKGTIINGSVETHGNLRIEGKIFGDITTKSKLVIGQPAIIEGNVLAQNADVEGEIIGTIKVADTLVLKPTAKIHGDIIVNKLIVEAGAQFNGKSKMGEKIKDIQIGNISKNTPQNFANKERKEATKNFHKTTVPAN